jgi:hypothetical protein
VADRKPFLLRLDPAVHDALQRWAGDGLRSVNLDRKFLIRRAVAGGRAPPRGGRRHSSRKRG